MVCKHIETATTLFSLVSGLKHINSKPMHGNPNTGIYTECFHMVQGLQVQM